MTDKPHVFKAGDTLTSYEGTRGVITSVGPVITVRWTDGSHLSYTPEEAQKKFDLQPPASDDMADLLNRVQRLEQNLDYRDSRIDAIGYWNYGYTSVVVMIVLIILHA